jgi:hypothetical protein
MIAAVNSWIIGYENVSQIPPHLSDTMCSLATGGAFATRELYTDMDETIFSAMRPIIVNGIGDLSVRSDLLDRMLIITLPEVPESRRKSEEELYKRLDAVRASILGALLTAVSAAMKRLPEIRLQEVPRMADFVYWGVAGEQALGIASGAFMEAYRANRDSTHLMAIEASVVGPVVVSLMKDRAEWTGTVKALLVAMEGLADAQSRQRREWPRTPRKLSGDLRRLAPNLRRAGIKISFEGHTREGTSICIKNIPTTAVGLAASLEDFERIPQYVDIRPSQATHTPPRKM